MQPNLALIEPPEEHSDLIASCQARITLLLECYQQDYQRLQTLIKHLAARSLEFSAIVPVGDGQYRRLTAEEARLWTEEVMSQARKDPIQRLLFELSPKALEALEMRLGEWLANLRQGGAA